MKSKRCIHTIKNECNAQTTFVILCGKKSNKRGYKNIPLTQINSNETIIDIQIKTIINNYKHSEIIIVSGFEHEKIVKHLSMKNYSNVRIAENKDYKTSNVFDGWRFALNIAVSKNTYIIHGDRLFDGSFLKGNISNTHTFVHDINKNNYDLGILFSNNLFINMSYGLPNVWSEIFFIAQNDFHKVRNIANEYRQRKIYNIESFLNIISKNIPISVISQNPRNIKVLKEL